MRINVQGSTQGTYRLPKGWTGPQLVIEVTTVWRVRQAIRDLGSLIAALVVLWSSVVPLSSSTDCSRPPVIP
jgi:hypothetical protein